MQKNFVFIIAGIILFIGGGLYFARSGNESVPSQLDGFAQCLKDKGAVFYGAFWCPHCQAQKALFGKSVSKLPYTECSLPSGQGQTQICIDKTIKSYPTWEFADGSRVEGELTLEELRDKTTCELPATN